LGLTKGSQHSNHIVIIHGRLLTFLCHTTSGHGSQEGTMTKAVAGANPTGIFQLSRAISFGWGEALTFLSPVMKKGDCGFIV